MPTAPKTAEKSREVVETQQDLPIHIETTGPTASAEIAEVEEVVTSPAPPTAEEIHKAILTLATLQLQAEDVAGEGEPGDVFLCYDLSLRIHGEPPLRLKGSRCMHRILLPEGLASATTEMESTLFTVVQPLKQRLLAKIGLMTSHNRGEIPRPTLPGYSQ